ncbi:potassium channel family protein [Cellulosilyticum ruminicola]|uniref:potassium channel family protein n=1 Tax=Cellulosilyticum ruminicola TaxID=425254 RepID=UPI0006CF9498|nr:potassium channel family protein [Cellulosilyticum ruminicola]
MYILLLIGLLSLWLWRSKEKQIMDFTEKQSLYYISKRIQNGGIIDWFIPFYNSADKGERLAGLLQIGVVAVVSFINTLKVVDYKEGLLIFCVTFIVCTWLIRVMVIALNWLNTYSKMLTLNGAFTILAPLIILWHMPKMNSMVEIQLTFMTLLLSTFNVYGEVVHIVTGHKLYSSKSIQIKSILTWLGIILMNLYCLLVFVQFYMNVKVHHFIAAEQLTREAMIDLFYYLIVTFTTVGFGDIRPTTNLAKVITCIIAISGMLFTGMFMGAILSSDHKL